MRITTTRKGLFFLKQLITIKNYFIAPSTSSPRTFKQNQQNHTRTTNFLPAQTLARVAAA